MPELERQQRHLAKLRRTRSRSCLLSPRPLQVTASRGATTPLAVEAIDVVRVVVVILIVVVILMALDHTRDFSGNPVGQSRREPRRPPHHDGSAVSHALHCAFLPPVFFLFRLTFRFLLTGTGACLWLRQKAKWSWSRFLFTFSPFNELPEWAGFQSLWLGSAGL
jgi:hypothetical protein